MKDEEIRGMLVKCKTVAVIGISPKEDRPSYTVASYLKSKGYKIIPVRPDGETILGEKVHHTLQEIPPEVNIDIVLRGTHSPDALMSQERNKGRSARPPVGAIGRHLSHRTEASLLRSF